MRAIRDTRAALRERGVPAFEVDLLSDQPFVSRGAERFIAINTYLFHPGEQAGGTVKVGLRFDLADKHCRHLCSFGVFSEFAIQAMREVNRVGEELPIPAVAIEPGGEPARLGNLQLTVSLVQISEEPEPQPLMCFSLAQQDLTSLYCFALNWRRAMLAMRLAFENPPHLSTDQASLGSK